MRKRLSEWIRKKINGSSKPIFLILCVLLFLTLWQWKLFPYSEQIARDFNYSADIISSEEIYNENTESYEPETNFDAKLKYKTIAKEDGVLLMNATYEKLDKLGNIVSSISKQYGIDPKTGAHVTGYSDKDREGYLFAPNQLKESDYQYWHIDCDMPINMHFLGKEEVSGLTIYHYSAHDMMKHQEDGHVVDINLNLWVEPMSNKLIKYSDKEIVYNYNFDSDTRLNPIKRTNDEFTLDFISKQIKLVQTEDIRIYLSKTVTPILLCILFALAIQAALENRGKTWKNSPYFLSIFTLVFILSSTVFIWTFASDTISIQTNSKFQTEATSIENTIIKRLDVYVNSLQGAKALFAASVEVSAEEWHTYSNTVKMNFFYPGVEGVVYRNVDNSISYVEIFEGSDPTVFDEDIFLNATDAQNDARDTGNPSITDAISFTNENYKVAVKGFLLIVPIYKNGESTKTVEEKRNAIQGYVYAPIVMKDFIHYMLYDILLNQKYNIDFEIYFSKSGTELDEKNELYGGATSINNTNPKFYKKDIIDIYGKEWTIVFTSLPGYSGGIIDNILPITIIIIGIMLSILVSSSVYILKSNKNRAEQLAKIMTKDLKDEKKQIASAKAKDDALLTSIADGVIVLDNKGIILFANRSTMQMLQEKPVNLLGKKMIKVIKMFRENGEEIPDKERPLIKALKSKKIMEAHSNENHFFQRRDGTHFPIAFTISPVFLEKRMIGLIGVYRDVTKEREVDKEKTEFVSLASHQLRTPLTAVKWYTESLIGGDNGTLNPAQKKQLKQIQIGNQRMVELVNSLLEVSRLEMGTFATENKKIDLNSLAENSIKDFLTEFKKKKLKLTLHIQKNLPGMFADPKHIEIIFQNLLSNAINYTKKNGKIHFNLLFNKNKNSIELMISDTGCGIPKKQHKTIFTKLFRAENAREIIPDGTGLGLYIVKSIIDRMKGKISFQSEENKGTTFRVTLPLNHLAHNGSLHKEVNRYKRK